MASPSAAIDGCLIAGGFTVSAIWLFKRDWLEQPVSHQRLLRICIALAAIGALGVVCVLLGVKTYLYCLIFPLPILYVHDWLFRFFHSTVGRPPEDTFMRWGQGLGPDYIYNFLFATVAFVGPMLGAFLPFVQSNKT
jgi:hypothetical protein